MSLPKILHPTFELILPSLKTKVSLRPMLVREEKILLMAKTSGLHADMLSSVRQVVNNCLVTKLDINKLPIFDLEYLYVQLRAASVNNIAKVSYRDNEDGQTYDFDVDLAAIKVKWPSEDITKAVEISPDYSLVLKYPDCGLYANKTFLDSLNSEDGANLDILLHNTIDKICKGDQMIEPSFENPQAVADFIDNLPIKAYNQIKEFWANIPSLYHELTYTNKNGDVRTIKLQTLQDFFPFA